MHRLQQEIDNLAARLQVLAPSPPVQNPTALLRANTVDHFKVTNDQFAKPAGKRTTTSLPEGYGKGYDAGSPHPVFDKDLMSKWDGKIFAYGTIQLLMHQNSWD